MDIERTFAVLDGKTVDASYATTIGAIDLARHASRNRFSARRSTNTWIFGASCRLSGQSQAIVFKIFDLASGVGRIRQEA
ncbi:hypothetical protein [Microvirga lotononidis]|uniref:Uncharacterized protein n=1 Tax=Microvirga lotononidis TaxID=864069 RepID=I4Z1V0_9HYPH|nr:hypothetical protein [Microvirga lotononidis]EIM30192.1 hypothetical protein MicloDRAFT_00009970 [Microvirga lotononidis]WQO31583.1 hypothetical protein U0023_29865 [Microvirga lotononidis]